MDDFLVKPLRATDLQTAMRRIVEGAPPPEWMESPPEQSKRNLVDPNVLLAACGGDEQILSTVSESFRNHVPVQMAAIVEALQAGNTMLLREHAHKLSGISAAFSTIAGELASQLEDLAAAGRLEGCRPIVEKLGQVARALIEEMGGLSIESLRKLARTAPD
jgi:HPt (histidine-containing phosphotransfer) domain-containing protein